MSEETKAKLKDIFEWAYCIIIAVVLALLIRYYVGTPTIVKQSSMYPTFKQNDKQIYHARDMAVYLASLLNIPIILSSATPSVESYANAISGKYKYIKLETRYHCKALLPDINIHLLLDNQIQIKFYRFLYSYLISY